MRVGDDVTVSNVALSSWPLGSFVDLRVLPLVQTGNYRCGSWRSLCASQQDHWSVYPRSSCCQEAMLGALVPTNIPWRMVWWYVSTFRSLSSVQDGAHVITITPALWSSMWHLLPPLHDRQRSRSYQRLHLDAIPSQVSSQKSTGKHRGIVQNSRRHSLPDLGWEE